MHSRFWAEAACYFVFIKNLVPLDVLGNVSPWKAFTKKVEPSLPKFIFGSRITFWRPPEKGAKLKPRGVVGFYLGPGMSASQRSNPGSHRLWDLTDKCLRIVADVCAQAHWGTATVCEDY